MQELSNQVALVTGAGSPRGIGCAVVQSLAKAGAHIAATDIAAGQPDAIQQALGYRYGADQGLDATVETARAHGVEAIGITADVGDPAQVQALVQGVRDHFGRLDFLVNVAGGVWGSNRIGEYDPEQWWQTVRVNLYGVFLTTHYSLPLLEAQGGSIVNIASIAAERSHDMLSPYGAAKAGVVQFTRDVAAEYGPQGIRANVLLPGDIETDMNAMEMKGLAMLLGVGEDEARQMNAASTPLRRMGQPADVGEAVAWLCSPRASFITGAAIPLTGGRELLYRGH